MKFKQNTIHTVFGRCRVAGPHGLTRVVGIAAECTHHLAQSTKFKLQETHDKPIYVCLFRHRCRQFHVIFFKNKHMRLRIGGGRGCVENDFVVRLPDNLTNVRF